VGRARIDESRIDTLETIESALGRWQLRFVLAWAELHEAELLENWRPAANGETLNRLNRSDDWTNQYHRRDCRQARHPAAHIRRWPAGPAQRPRRMQGPVFAQARTPEGFAKVAVDPETGTVVAPSGLARPAITATYLSAPATPTIGAPHRSTAALGAKQPSQRAPRDGPGWPLSDTTSHSTTLVIRVPNRKRVSAPRVEAHLPFANLGARGRRRGRPTMPISRVGTAAPVRTAPGCAVESCRPRRKVTVQLHARSLPPSRGNRDHCPIGIAAVRH
jgi:hypothetical protein